MDSGHKNIKIIPGNASILISAPHATSIIKTVKGRTYIRMAEKRVQEVVEKLNDKKGVWGIYTISDGPLEGWQEGTYRKYKQTVKKLTQANNIGLILDIHAAKRERPFFIDYDFILPNRHEHDHRVEKLLNQKFSNYFPREKLSSSFYRSINGSGYKTLTYYARNYLDTLALQLEINKKLKDDDVQFNKVIKMLNEFLEEYESTIAGI